MIYFRFLSRSRSHSSAQGHSVLRVATRVVIDGKLDTVDMMMLARANETMRRIVKVHTYRVRQLTTVVKDMKEEIFRKNINETHRKF